MATFKKADRTKKKLRLALDGPAGSGKTLTALRFAMQLAKHEAAKSATPRAPRVAVIDTENGSASIYQGDQYDDGIIDFDVVELADFSPTKYSEIVRMAAVERFDVLVIDSLSHAWSGKGGALEIVDKKASQSSSGNAFSSWKDVTPLQNEMMEAIIRAPLHVIVTMRTKTEWILEQNERGKMVPRKVGMAPVQRQGVEYEFDIVLDIDQDHIAHVTKSRCSAIADRSSTTPGAEFIAPVIHWLNQGGDIPEELLDAARLEMSKPAMTAKPLSGAGGTDKPETAAERLERLKAAKATSAPAIPATVSAPLVSNQPAATAPASTIKPLSGKPAIKPLQAAPTTTPAATTKPTETAKPAEKPVEQPTGQPAEILTRGEDSASEACDKPAEVFTPITDADMPPDAPPHPFILANADATKPATPRQCAVILAMYAAMELTPEVIESACRNRSPSNGTTVYDVCEEGARDMINKARKKMLKDDPNWLGWLERINEKYAEHVNVMAEVPF